MLTRSKLSSSNNQIILQQSQWQNVNVYGWALLHERLLRGGLLLPSISYWEHRPSWLLINCLMSTCHLWRPHFSMAQDISMHHTHFGVRLLTILLHPTPCRNPLGLNSPSHPHKALSWLKSLSWLTHQWICLISAAQWWKVICRQRSLRSSACSPHSSVFTTSQGVSYSAVKTDQRRFILIRNFLTTQVFHYFCSACLDRGKATYSMH